jgi:hypothetical protein
MSIIRRQMIDAHDPLVLALMALDREHTPFDRMFASIGSIR